MCRDGAHLLQAGVEAADFLLGEVLRLPIEKALNPLEHAQFVILVRRTARALRNEAVPIEQAVADAAIALVDANWPGMTARQREAKIIEVKALFGPAIEKELPGLQVAFEASADSIVGPTRRQLVKRYDFAIQPSLTARDKETAQGVRDTEALFVRNNYGEVATKLSEKARSIVAVGLEKGLGRDDISGDLAEAMKAARRSDSYWNLIATTFSNHSRNFTQVHALEEAGIRAYSPLAVLDEVTTECCRMLNGREFPVASAVKLIKRAQELDDPEKIAERMPWIQQGKTEDGDDVLYYKKGLQRHLVAQIDEPGEGVKDKIGAYSKVMPEEAMNRAGIGMPPYHGNCRTTIVPVF